MSTQQPTTEAPAEPVRPEDWECCNSDCGDACVWQIYYRDKAQWDAQQQAQQESTP